MAIGFALPPVILATGRRATALLPLVPALGATYPGVLHAYPEHWWNGAAWPRGELASGALTLALLAVPAVVIAVVCRPEPCGRLRVSSLAAGGVRGRSRASRS